MRLEREDHQHSHISHGALVGEVPGGVERAAGVGVVADAQGVTHGAGAAPAQALPGAGCRRCGV